MTNRTHDTTGSRFVTDVLVVGAGMAGLTAAVEIQQTGREVLVIDKGRGVGGRMASRRIGGATFDHGAQFFTARNPRFAGIVDGWLAAGVAEEWWGPSATQPEAHPRWRGCPSMTAIAKHLARDVEVLVEKRVVSLHPGEEGWLANLEGGETVRARAVLLTAPVPQSLDLLMQGGIELSAGMRARLEAVTYERCIAVMAVLEGASRIPPPGGFAPTEGPIVWIADNQTKGISALPAVTIHASAEFSTENWDRDRQAVGRALLDTAASWLGTGVTDFQVHGWLYSKPERSEEDPCLVLSQSPLMVLAGDAFAGARVEGAALSGWAAADILCRGH